MDWSVGMRTAASGAVANDVACQLWNPHTTMRVQVYAIHIFHQAATQPLIGIKRSTARGATPGATATPTIANSFTRELLPASGAVLESGNFATEPTLEGTDLYRWMPAAVIGSGVIWVPRGELKIGPASGLCIYVATALAMGVSDISFECAD